MRSTNRRCGMRPSLYFFLLPRMCWGVGAVVCACVRVHACARALLGPYYLKHGRCFETTRYWRVSACITQLGRCFETWEKGGGLSQEEHREERQSDALTFGKKKKLRVCVSPE